jgi:hypothetical protein
MVIWVLKIASVTAPKGFLCWFDDNGACDLGLPITTSTSAVEETL